MTKILFGNGKRAQTLFADGHGKNFPYCGSVGKSSPDNQVYATIANSTYFLLVEIDHYTQLLRAVKWAEDRHLKPHEELPELSGINMSIRQLHMCLLYFDKMCENLWKFFNSKHLSKADRKTARYSQISDEFEMAKNFVSSVINKVKHANVFLNDINLLVRFDHHTQILAGVYLLEITNGTNVPYEFKQKYRSGCSISLSMIGWQILTFCVRLNQVVSSLYQRADIGKGADIGSQLEFFSGRAIRNLLEIPFYALDDISFYNEFALEIDCDIDVVSSQMFGSLKRPWKESKVKQYQGTLETVLFNGSSYGQIGHDSWMNLLEPQLVAPLEPPRPA